MKIIQHIDKTNEETVSSPIISVIVPIYNVEQYVRKCLESLRRQKLKQIEIICIDDGSTDGSGRIAEEYQSVDFPILRVIHTKNMGLSAARNRGIDESRAQWLMFVDSDDWVDDRFCETPYETAIKYDSDLVCFMAFRVTRFGCVKKTKNVKMPTGIVDEVAAHEYGGYAVWNKLYKRSLFDDIRFPEGHVYEELATAHRFVNEADRITLLVDRLYYYRDRKGSLSHNYEYSYLEDGLRFALNRYDFLINLGYSFRKMELLPQIYSIRYLTSVLPSQDELYLRASEIVDSIIVVPREFTTKQKIVFIAWKIDRRLFYLICRLSGRICNKR